MTIRYREPAIAGDPEDYNPLVGDGPEFSILPHATATEPVEGVKAFVQEDGKVLLMVDYRFAARFPDVQTAGCAAFLIEAALRVQRQAMAH